MAREGEFTGTTQQEFVSCAAGLLENHGPGDLTVTFVYSTGEHERRELSPMQRFKWQPRDTEPALVEKVQVVPDSSTTFYFAHSEYARGVPPAESFHRRIILQPRDASGSAVPLDIDIAAQTLNRVAIDIEAATIGNISVDIAAQSVGNLAMDIAAQSVGNLNVNIAASAVTLNVDLVAQTVGNVDINLAASAITLNVDITATTVGNLNIDIAAQTVNVDIIQKATTTSSILATEDATFEVDDTLTDKDFITTVSGAGRVGLVAVEFTKNSGAADSAETDVALILQADGDPADMGLFVENVTMSKLNSRVGTRTDNPIGHWLATYDTTNQDFRWLFRPTYDLRFDTEAKLTVRPLANVDEQLTVKVRILYYHADTVTEKEQDQGAASSTDTSQTGGSEHPVPM